MTLSPLTRRRLTVFRANKRGYWSLIIFSLLIVPTLFAEFLANDRPILVRYDGAFYAPILRDYLDTDFGGDLGIPADFTDAELTRQIRAKGWAVWPLIPFNSFNAVKDLGRTGPTPPTARNLLGTDGQSRDVVARLVYGLRISVLFGLILTVVSSIVGIAAGAVQGYFGGLIDLLFQRFLELWSSLPQLYVLILMASIIEPTFWSLLGIMLLFSWTTLVGLVRAEFLRTRNFDYVRAARALGVSDSKIMIRHMLPNATISTMTYLPFIAAGSVTTLTALDFLNFGLPPGSPSLGELLLQGKDNLQAPWLGLTGFFVIAILLTLLIFIGEAVRDAFDPRKILA
ncbi:ABC transporter permease [Reyranella sp. CPCC 100927]|uniref:ABC transporter permease n=1 Tax=Reyranella sp. CPCC 100927 TaxID=2599616 RepID=UPI0011B6E63C|nr:ABC transporter permease [Reyranella sp. CPCC 100927]TWT03071.1 ABC transporter permease [Reyranella sp. CPCC 100927]